MHDEHDNGHRCTRVRYLVRTLGDITKRSILYTDAPRCQNGYSTLVLDGSETLLMAVSLQGSVPTYGKVLGVASAVRHAVQIPGEVYILNQSKQACHVYLVTRGFSRVAQRILHESPSTNTSDPPTKLPGMVCVAEGPDQVFLYSHTTTHQKYYTEARVNGYTHRHRRSRKRHQSQARTFPTCLNFARSITQTLAQAVAAST